MPPPPPIQAYNDLAFAYDQATGEQSLAVLRPVLEKTLRRRTLRTHLDLACGTGLAVRLFRERGLRSVGVDASLPMLRIARRCAPSIAAGDVRAIPLRGTFDVITCLNDAVRSLLRITDLVRCFRSVRTLMHRDSYFLFDMRKPRTIVAWANQDYVSRGRVHTVAIRATYSASSRLETLTFRGTAEDSGTAHTIDEVHYQRCYTRAEIEDALRRASMRAIDVVEFARFRRRPRTARLFVARII